ncbi:hypothetical protein HPC49_16710 [Pyxidicoccus fallax]|uniref:Uncharacterized protein n=1 Tax=Pyxidicoccus fallax TaxID=394095 RepID=A0A848LJB9_9BACT|nr:hypothetical protein [Pyxidicoccus fallax]NMO17819.1 hypothetical protein [Pyxidicoccus fallax]NPC79859.1 hypothetical protein [Pyxidicoccus fallax]
MSDRHQSLTELEDLIRSARETSLEISRDQLRQWMSSPDLEVQGATYLLLRESMKSLRITPPLDADEHLRFRRDYLERCIREGGEGPWSDSRYEAAWEIAGWMASVFDDPATARKVLVGLRDWLATIYREGSPVVRDALVNGTLEHLFERPKIRRFFNDWRNDPLLAGAFADASLWAREGGDSPLVGRRKPRPGRKNE